MAEEKAVFIEKREGERVRIGINEYKEKEYIDIRQYYEGEEEGDWRPTKKGVTLPPDSLEELEEAVRRLREMM